MDWSPDGRVLMTATTAPRMRVNNGIQFFRQGTCRASRLLVFFIVSRDWPHSVGLIYVRQFRTQLLGWPLVVQAFTFLCVASVRTKRHACRYTGDTLHEQKYPVLLEARWRPMPAGAFDDRPSSPRKGGTVAANASAAPIRAAGYVPPHVRSSGGEASSLD